MRINDGWQYSSKVVTCVDALGQGELGNPAGKKKKMTYLGRFLRRRAIREGRKNRGKYEDSAETPTTFSWAAVFHTRIPPYLETVLCSIN